MRIHLLLVGVVSLVVLIGCKKDAPPTVDCTTVLPPEDWFQIGVVDTSGNYLIGSTFVADSFHMYSPSSSYDVYLKPVPFANTPEFLRVPFVGLPIGQECYLELDGSDTDTLVFDYATIEHDCYTEYRMNAIEYNGASVDLTVSNTPGFLLFKN